MTATITKRAGVIEKPAIPADGIPRSQRSERPGCRSKGFPAKVRKGWRNGNIQNRNDCDVDYLSGCPYHSVADGLPRGRETGGRRWQLKDG